MRHAVADQKITDPPARPGLLRFTRMTGSSIASVDAATWVTDFVNAAYYRRSADDRAVDDLRLASCVLTTYWYSKPQHRGAEPAAPAGPTDGHGHLTATNAP